MRDFQHMQVSLFTPKEKVPSHVIMPHLCHGDTIAVIETGREDLQDTDGLITVRNDIALGVRTADCAAVCCANEHRVGIAHVGWRGLCLGLVGKMMSRFGTSAEVFIGPHIHRFEIQKDHCYETIDRVFGTTFFSYAEDRIFFHFRDALFALVPNAVFDPRDTYGDSSLPSHRRTGTRERLTTVVHLKNAPNTSEH